MHDWLGLDGKTVLLIGAGGFGEPLVRAYLEAGSRVHLVDIDGAKLERLEKEFAGLPLRTSEHDVADKAGCEEAAERAVAELGGVDVFVHAVGVNGRSSIEDTTEEEWLRTIQLNASGCLWLGRRVGRAMRDAGGGRMVFFSSVSGALAHPRHGAYAASKGALNQILRVMAIEWAEHGIAVNAVAPGYALTPLTEAYCAVPGNLEHLVERIPMGRLATPEDIVGPTLFLSSDRSSYVTGQVVVVDGGRTLD